MQNETTHDGKCDMSPLRGIISLSLLKEACRATQYGVL